MTQPPAPRDTGEDGAPDAAPTATATVVPRGGPDPGRPDGGATGPDTGRDQAAAQEPLRPPAPRRTIAAALLLGVSGAALVLYAVSRTWAEGEVAVRFGQQTLLSVSARGSDVTAVPGALALVGLAALVAVFAVRRTGRVLVSALLALSGAVTVATAVLGAADSSALDDDAAQASGLSDATAVEVTHTAWPWVAAAGGALLLLAGLLALAKGRDWPGMSSRYEAPGGARAPRRAARAEGQDRSADLWRALDRGEDPTDQ